MTQLGIWIVVSSFTRSAYWMDALIVSGWVSLSISSSQKCIVLLSLWEYYSTSDDISIRCRCLWCLIASLSFSSLCSVLVCRQATRGSHSSAIWTQIISLTTLWLLLFQVVGLSWKMTWWMFVFLAVVFKFVSFRQVSAILRGLRDSQLIFRVCWHKFIFIGVIFWRLPFIFSIFFVKVACLRWFFWLESAISPRSLCVWFLICF